MRIDSSSISMAASRSYNAVVNENRTTISRYYGNGYVNASESTIAVKTRHFEAEGGTAVFTASAGEGIARTDKNQVGTKNALSEKGDPESKGGGKRSPGDMLAHVNSDHWISNYIRGIEDDPHLEALKRLLDMLDRFTGKSSDRRFLTAPAKLAATSGRYYKMTMAAASVSSSARSAAIAIPESRSGQVGVWTRQTVTTGFARGEEHTAFRSTGSAVTSDGRCLSFGISLEMSRSFEMAYEVTGAETVYTDPLVINLDTDAASISDVSFYFDLDCDGKEERLSSLGAGSGFLALDKNGDGKINNGAELFGTKSGDGFSDLTAYDSDNNGWIDENDSVFASLSVWMQSGAGEPELISLSAAGVGAIFLGSQNTLHTLADPLGREGAVVRQTGIYLRENGQAGTIQHIDFKT